MIRIEAVTSDEKSTRTGESARLVKCDFRPARSSESPRVSESGVARLLGGNDVYFANERIRQGGFPVVVVRDDTHGPDVVCLVNDLADLIHYEI